MEHAPFKMGTRMVTHLYLLVIRFKIFGNWLDNGSMHPNSNFFHIHLGAVLRALSFTLLLCSVDPITLLVDFRASLALVCYPGPLCQQRLVPHGVDHSGLPVSLFCLDEFCLVSDC